MAKQLLKKTIWLTIFFSLFVCGEVAAEAASSSNQAEGAIENAFYPPPDEFDWIQLTSGEWLKGELKVLYDFRLEFDSDELDLLKFDWEDVQKLRTHRLVSIRFDDGTTLVGKMKIDGDRVTLFDGEKVSEFVRGDIVTIAAGEPKESNYWSAKISLGINIRRGNSDILEYNVNANAKRRTSSSRILLDYLGNINRTEGIETANNQRLSGSYDIFKTRNFFWRPVFGEYFRDPFQNIENQVNLGTGFGYHIIRTTKTEWDVTGGVGGKYVEFVSVQPGENISSTSPSLFGGTRYETELTKWMDFEVEYGFQVVNEESGTFTHHSIATFSTEVTSKLDFDVSFVWDFTQNPQPRADGTIPVKDDFRFIIGLGIDF